MFPRVESHKAWVVYVLKDPRTQRVRYVGWTFDLHKRLRNHITRAPRESTHKACWIKGLLSAGMEPVAEVVESGDGAWADAERRWIAQYRADGADLTNLTDGGEGVVGLAFGAESRAKMSAAKLGRPQTAEHIERSHAPLRGRQRPTEVVARAVNVKKEKGYTHSPETRAKLSIAGTGRVPTAETRAKIGAAHTGGHLTEATKEKLRAKRVGKPLSAEHREKLSAAKLGRKLSDEHKAKIRAASGGWSHTEEAKARITAARRARG